jgi:hypothetical protein
VLAGFFIMVNFHELPRIFRVSALSRGARYLRRNGPPFCQKARTQGGMFRRCNVVVYKTAVVLNRMERDNILGWLECHRDGSLYHDGPSRVNPEEQEVVRVLQETPLENRCVFTDEQALLMRGWMETAILRRYGTAKYVPPAEQSVYEKISAFVDTALLSRVDDP